MGRKLAFRLISAKAFMGEPFLITPPMLAYLAIGLLVARINLDDAQPRSFTGLQWAQFLVDIARITLLWPLVLLVEKVVTWLKK